jgi:hydroxypyruvate isomerase
MSLSRREFARTIAGVGAGVAAGTVLTSVDAASAPSVPPPSTPFSLSVMLWTIYRDRPFQERLEKVAQAGYHAVELVGEFKDWSDQDFGNVNRKKRELGITFDATSGLHASLCDPSKRDEFLSEVRAILPTMEKLECNKLIVLTGNKVPGLSLQEHHSSCVEGLKKAADLAGARNVQVLLENIDPEENPRYFLTSVAEGFEIVREVNSPHVRFLYDFFHEQISEGNLIEKLEKNIDLVGLVHVADVPGRHEPGTGEIHYPNIYRKLVQLKYDRYVAMEFLPTGDPVASLREAREQVLKSVAS